MSSGARDLFIPEHVNIVNFNNIVSFSCDIPSMTIVSGKNGSGKTSLAEAIGFCLTGEPIRAVKAKDLIRNGQDEMAVTVTGTFSSATGEYNKSKIVIIRSRTQKKEVVKIVIGEGEDAVEVNNQEEFLNSIISPMEFKKLYYVNGHEIGEFLHGNASQYSEMLDKLFSINALTDVIKEIKTSKMENDSISLKAKKQVLESKKTASEQGKKIKELKRDLDRERETIEKELPALEGKNGSLEKEISSLETEVSGLSTRINALRLKNREMEGNEKRRSSLATSIKEIETSKKGLEASIEALRKELSIKEDEDVEKTIEARNNATRDELAKTEARLAVLKDLPKLLSAIMKVPVEGDACPLCLTKGKREAANENMKNQSDSVDKMNAKRGKLREDVSMLDDRKSKTRNLFSSLDRVKNERTSLAKAYKEVKDLMESSGPIGDEENVDKLVERLDSIQKGLQQKRDERSKTSFQLDSYRKKMERGIEGPGSLETEWTSSDESEMLSVEEKLKNLSSKVDRLSSMKSDMREVLSTIRERFISEINPIVMETIKHFTTGNEHITKFVMSQKTVERKDMSYHYYDFQAAVDGADLQFESLSTGQKAVVLLSMILAVNDFSRKSLSMLIFDEIDNAGMDNDSLKMILKSILSLSKNLKVIFINRDKRINEFIQKATEAEEIESSVVDFTHGMDSATKTLE